MTEKQMIMVWLGVVTAAIVYLILLSPTSAQNDTGGIPAELQQYVNPAQGFVNFFMSDLWLWFWVLLIVGIIFTPFGIKGMIDSYRWANRNFFRPRSGQVLVRQKLPNDRMREFWVKPTGKYMKFKTIDHEEIEQPIRMEKGWNVFENNIPVIYLDENNQQMQIGTRFQNPGVSQEEITRGYKASYDTGKLIGAVDFFNDIKNWLLIILIVTVVVGSVNAYFGYQIQKTLGTQKMDSTEIAQKVAAALFNASSIQAGNKYPTVGG